MTLVVIETAILLGANSDGLLHAILKGSRSAANLQSIIALGDSRLVRAESNGIA